MLGGRKYVDLAVSATTQRPCAPLSHAQGRKRGRPRIYQASLSTGLPMARYYFHVRHGRATILDNHGVEFADLVEAANEATRRALQIAQREALEGASQINRCAIIVDDEVSTIFEVPVTSWQKNRFVPRR